MMNKNNVPYYIAGTLATFTLLASGVFAAAPYIGFLAPVAALSVGLPFIVGCAVFSVVTIALSYKAISKNKTISEKDTQPADEKSKVEVKDSEEREIVEGSSVSRLARAAVVGATATGGIAGVAVLGGIAGGMVGCTLGSVILGLYVDNSKEGDARRGAIIDNAAVNEAYSSGRVPGIVKRGLTDVYYPPIGVST